MDNVTIVDHRILYILCKSLSCDCKTISVKFRKQFLYDSWHSTGKTKVMYRVFCTTWNDMGKKRYLVRCFIEILPPRLVITCFMRDSRNMKNKVRRCCQCHIHLDSIADRFRCDDLPCSNSLLYKTHDTASCFICHMVKFT